MADKTTPITKYKRFSWLNIGTVLFLTILIYMIITVIIYLTASHITSYEVTAGAISGNYRYMALALKSEQIETADYSGYVHYYTRAGAKTGTGMTVCSIDENETPTVIAEDAVLSEEDLSYLHKGASSFAVNYDSSAFSQVYTFKSDLEAYLLSALSEDNITAAYVNQVTSPVSGFVSYQIDGMEGLTEADLNRSLFNRTKYDVRNLRLNSQVRMGDELYKLVLGEEWYLYFPISSELATALSDRSSIRFRFLKDDTTFTAGFSVVTAEDGFYGRIRLRNSLVRYVSDRYLEIELLMDSRKGLKIPTSSISEKSFLKIPLEYVTVNEDDNSEVTFLREYFRKDGSQASEYITTRVYDRQNDGIMVSNDLLKDGDYVVREGTTKKHQVVPEDRTTIQGVYNINKGYAVFREVKVVDENEEFCIVEPYNPYGLAAHDFIALDAGAVGDDDIVT